MFGLNKYFLFLKVVLTKNFTYDYSKPTSELKSESVNTVKTLLFEERRRETIP